MRQAALLAFAAASLIALPSSAAVPQRPNAVPMARAHAPQPGRALSGYLTPQELSDAVYIGSEYCLACHSDMTRWRSSLHAEMVIRPMTRWSLQPGKGVLSDGDANGVDDFQQGIDFNRSPRPSTRTSRMRRASR